MAQFYWGNLQWRRYTDKRRAGQPMLGSIYPAIQNLCLAAHAYGLGTAITGLHKHFEDEINQRLRVPPGYENEILIPLGYPKGRWSRPARKAASDVTFFERWGTPEQTETRPVKVWQQVE